MRAWTKEEVDLLEERWGMVSIKALSKKLNRNIDAVKMKAKRLGLGDAKTHYDGITVNQLAEVLNVHHSFTIKLWIEKHGLPIKYKIFAQEERVRVIKYQDFWKWAEQHKQLINFARMNPLSLGPEPDWVEEKRNADLLSVQKKKRRPWTKEEDQILIGMVKAFCFTHTEIAARLNRTEGAVRRRILSLGLKGRPVRRENKKYTSEEVEILVDMYNKGYGFNTIAQKLGKSELAIRGKLERLGYRFKNGVPVIEEKEEIKV